MIALPLARAAWPKDTPKDGFAGVLKREIEALPRGSLPLAQAVSWPVDERDLRVMVMGAEAVDGQIHARIGVFFGEIIAGCSCGDEPQMRAAYAELAVLIAADATAVFSPL
ncbi:MAG: glucosamine--fructose-6-phosphate aminotransferase [Betaproteobacteria bacterium]|nr:MAG: glucosamine--fructose-6-phosphate aminotransferase [Betaproteobacteria bacterium]